jgi:hypothetical protein
MGEHGSEGSIIAWLSESTPMSMANWISTSSNSNSSEVALSGKVEQGVEGKDAGKDDGEDWEYMLWGLVGVGRVSYIEKEKAEALSSEKA